MEIKKDPQKPKQSWERRAEWRNQPFWIQIILQSYSYQDSMELAQKQKYRPMEHDSKLRNILTKEARIYNVTKIDCSLNGAGKTGQLHVKKWN